MGGLAPTQPPFGSIKYPRWAPRAFFAFVRQRVRLTRTWPLLSKNVSDWPVTVFMTVQSLQRHGHFDWPGSPRLCPSSSNYQNLCIRGPPVARINSVLVRDQEPVVMGRVCNCGRIVSPPADLEAV